MLVNFLSDLHKGTKRNYLARMTQDKVECMKVARKFGKDYWDGDRRYGYGGYRYDGRWKPVAEKLVKRYKLSSKSSVLDMGCGKGFLAYEIKKLTGCYLRGCDISGYALKEAKIKGIFKCDIGVENIAFNSRFDLVLCVNVLHNLTLPHLEVAIQNINRNSFNAYICVDSYRNEQELFNLQCWALTAECFFRPEEWLEIFRICGYRNDYEFIFFE